KWDQPIRNIAKSQRQRRVHLTSKVFAVSSSSLFKSGEITSKAKHFHQTNNHNMAARTLHALSTSPLFLLLLFFAASSPTKAQQPYVNNHQLACENRDFDNITNGFTCNGPPSCRSYLTFWSQPPYNTPSSIAGLLNASAAEIQYLLTYLVAQGDSVSAIAEMFRSSSAAVSSGNELASDRIYFFTPLLDGTNQNREYSVADAAGRYSAAVAAGVSSGVVLFSQMDLHRSWNRSRFAPLDLDLISLLLLLQTKIQNVVVDRTEQAYGLVDQTVSSHNVNKPMVDRLIKLLRHHATINGDDAAVKVIKGDVSSSEISLLKKLNHSNIIRLSGFCIREGTSYLVYEYSENGSVSDWLHSSNKKKSLTWRQRVEICRDVAEALDYLHNYVTPPHIHKNLESTNVLLDSNFKAKISNFGVARILDEEGDLDLQLTRHVEGTQGYLAPEYVENGVITPKLDVFAFGVVVLELLSGKEAATVDKEEKEEMLLCREINNVLGGENVREKLKEFMDSSLGDEYPLELAFTMAQLAKSCVAPDINSRPSIAQVLTTLLMIVSVEIPDPETEFFASKQETGHEWELFKENVRPLKRGRNIRLLNHALKSHCDHQLRKTLIEKRRKLIEEIDEYDGGVSSGRIVLRAVGDIRAVREKVLALGATANEIFNLRISRNTKPVEKLNEAYKKFMVRTMRRSKSVDDEPKENELPSRSFGTVLSRGDNNRRQALGPQAKRTKPNQHLWLSTRTLHRGIKQSRTSQNQSLVPQKTIVRTAAASASSFEVFVDEEKDCTESRVEKKESETISSSSNILPLNDGREIKKNRAAATEPFKTLSSQQLPTMMRFIIFTDNHNRQRCSEI
ncbi:hypothetical protein HID58_062839, partial [Brassica napus]